MKETIGYKASKEMEEMLYKDSGIYKYKQIKKAASITLKSAHQEIELLWNQDVKYRPGFAIDGEYAKIPVFFSKVNGILDNKFKYWKYVKSLITKNSVLIRNFNIIKLNFFRRLRFKFINCFNNGNLDVEKLMKCKLYKYGTLQKSIQLHLIEKVKFIIDNRIFRGTFVSGTENKIITVFLNLPTNILRLIHNFDFTGKNPKIIYINVKSEMMPIEDAIIIVLLHYIGFDIVLFTPSGVNCIDQYLNVELINEYQIGEYAENVKIPNLYLCKIFFIIGGKIWDWIFQKLMSM
ncbi:MAG: hypothetical protein J6M39_05745 [Lachnospiraceae bacterium]|nr:hypothetical protein [Lachnospiraceae bacterium]